MYKINQNVVSIHVFHRSSFKYFKEGPIIISFRNHHMFVCIHLAPPYIKSCTQGLLHSSGLFVSYTCTRVMNLRKMAASLRQLLSPTQSSITVPLYPASHWWWLIPTPEPWKMNRTHRLMSTFSCVRFYNNINGIEVDRDNTNVETERYTC